MTDLLASTSMDASMASSGDGKETICRTQQLEAPAPAPAEAGAPAVVEERVPSSSSPPSSPPSPCPICLELMAAPKEDSGSTAAGLPPSLLLGPCGHRVCVDCAARSICESGTALFLSLREGAASLPYPRLLSRRRAAASGGGPPSRTPSGGMTSDDGGGALFTSTPCPGLLCPVCVETPTARAEYARHFWDGQVPLPEEEGADDLPPQWISEAAFAAACAWARRSGADSSSSSSPPVIPDFVDRIFDQTITLARLNGGGHGCGSSSGLVCPSSGCGQILAVEHPSPHPALPSPSPSPSHLTCPSCSDGFCGACAKPWGVDPGGEGSHAGRTCADQARALSSYTFRQRAEDVLASMPPGTKMCPFLDCGVPITRFKGHYCHEVACVCGRHYCYVCLTTADEWKATPGGAAEHFRVCSKKCDDACGCEACPTCAQGPGSRGKCVDAYTGTACEEPEKCISCALGGRAETEGERSRRLAHEAAAQAERKLRYPRWPGPRRFRKDVVDVDPAAAVDAAGAKATAYLARSLAGPARTVREGVRLLGGAVGGGALPPDHASALFPSAVAAAAADAPSSSPSFALFLRSTEVPPLAAWRAALEGSEGRGSGALCGIDEALLAFTAAARAADAAEAEVVRRPGALAPDVAAPASGPAIAVAPVNKEANAEAGDGAGPSGTLGGFHPVRCTEGGPQHHLALGLLPPYEDKSTDELRWEDRRLGFYDNAVAQVAAAVGAPAPAPAPTPAPAPAPTAQELEPRPTSFADGFPAALCDWRGARVEGPTFGGGRGLSVVLDATVSRAILVDLDFGYARPDLSADTHPASLSADRVPVYAQSSLGPLLRLLAFSIADIAHRDSRTASPLPAEGQRKSRRQCIVLLDVLERLLAVVPRPTDDVVGAEAAAAAGTPNVAPAAAAAASRTPPPSLTASGPAGQR
jgi:hypothetical protein